MHIYQVVQQVVQLGVADAAFVEAEVADEDGAYLADAAFGGIAMPLPRFAVVQRTADDADVGGDERTHIVAGMKLNLLFGHDDGDFGMTGANHTQGFRPAYIGHDYIARCLFFGASEASGAMMTRLLNFFIFTNAFNWLILKYGDLSFSFFSFILLGRVDSLCHSERSEE